MNPGGSAEFRAVVTRLANRVSRWTPPRWAASGRSGRSRAEIVHTLIQELADRAADVEGRPHRAVPRLDNDLALTDQLRVVAADLLAAADDRGALADAAARVSQAHRSL
jgi:hypothetical protein